MALCKNQVGFAPFLPSVGEFWWFAWLLSLPMVPGEHPAPGQDPWGADGGGREEPEDGALPGLFLRELLILED